MSDFWDNFVPLLLAICSVFFLYGLGHLMLVGEEARQARYEQCIAASMQWVEGNCVK